MFETESTQTHKYTRTNINTEHAHTRTRTYAKKIHNKQKETHNTAQTHRPEVIFEFKLGDCDRSSLLPYKYCQFQF